MSSININDPNFSPQGKFPPIQAQNQGVKQLSEFAAAKWSPTIQAQLQEGLTQPQLAPVSEKLAEVTNQALSNIESRHSLEEIHSEAQKAISEIQRLGNDAPADLKKEAVQLCALLENRIMFEVGSKAVNLLFSTNPSLCDIVQKFYRDEAHPMDLQRYLRHPETAVKVANILNNLTDITTNSEMKSILLDPDVNKFNNFLKDYIQINFKPAEGSQNSQNLMDVGAIDPMLTAIRERQGEYYSSLGISDQSVTTSLTFSTAESRQGIALLDSNETVPLMQQHAFFQNETSTYLKVPDAGNRIVSISNEGYQALQRLQAKNATDLIDVMGRLDTLFNPQGFLISGRTKSAKSILDKCGRLTQMTQSKDTPKYRSTLDIIDVNGCRITCSNSAEIKGVIDNLKANGFEFLELDNKYANIRKDGAYKVVPCTIRDSKTGVIFELQITTLTSTTVTDLYHNVIYKRQAIGLNASEHQLNSVLESQRLSAVLETISLKGDRIKLVNRLEKTELNSIASALNGVYENIKRQTI